MIPASHQQENEPRAQKPSESLVLEMASATLLRELALRAARTAALAEENLSRIFSVRQRGGGLAEESEPLLGQVLVCLWVTVQVSSMGNVALSLAHEGLLSGFHQNLYYMVQLSQVRLASGAGWRSSCSKGLKAITETGLGATHHSC